MARKAAVNIPPITEVPMATRLFAPAPVARARGRTPNMKAKLVIESWRNGSRSSNCCLDHTLALFLLLLSKFDHQNRIFRGEPHRRRKADLQIDVILQPPQRHRHNRTDQSQRNDKQYR